MADRECTERKLPLLRTKFVDAALVSGVRYRSTAIRACVSLGRVANVALGSHSRTLYAWHIRHLGQLTSDIPHPCGTGSSGTSSRIDEGL